MAGEKILVVDAEPETSELIKINLVREGYEVFVDERGLEAAKLVQQHEPDLIILDMILPEMNGIEVCRELRQTTQIPIVFVSRKCDDKDIILGLGVGGDDYIAKPFSIGQLVARVKAHLRRSIINKTVQLKLHKPVIKYKFLQIDLNNHTVMVRGKTHALSAKEFAILSHLAQNPNQIYHINYLFQLIWGSESLGDTRTLLVHISNLRKKIELDPANPEYIQTIRGVGYKFNGMSANY